MKIRTMLSGERLFSGSNGYLERPKLNKESFVFEGVSLKETTDFELDALIGITGAINIHLIMDNQNDKEERSSTIVFKDQLPIVFPEHVDFSSLVSALGHPNKDIKILSYVASRILAGLIEFRITKVELAGKVKFEFKASLKNGYMATEIINKKSVERFFQ